MGVGRLDDEDYPRSGWAGRGTTGSTAGLPGDRQVELVEGLDHRNPAAARGCGWWSCPGRQLGLDEGCALALGCPASGLGGDEQLRDELAHRGELEPAQSGDQVR